MVRTLRTSVWIVLLACTGCASPERSDLRQIAQQGDAQAQYELALALDYGDGLPRDLEEAAAWYAAAANQGHAEAQNSLGSLYQAGDGLARDDVRAASWYRKAADQGHAEAANNLAYLYDLGLGVEEDNRLAAELYERAAERGSVRAMLNLGVLLSQGQEGLAEDFVEACKWLELARFYSQRSTDGQLKWRVRAALDELEGAMAESQIEEARRRSREWDRLHRRGR